MNIEEMIKNLEEKNGRPLTEKERQAIEGMGMMLGAVWADKPKSDEK